VRDVRLHSGHYHVVTVGADDPVEEVIKVMEREQVRRLPVVDGTDLVGIISQADLARQCPPAQVGRLLAAISS
jgi:CBS domain-containing protein